jgi:hypothetical protein
MTPVSAPFLLAQALLAQTSAKAPRPGDWQFGWDKVAEVAAGALAIIFVAWLTTRFFAARQRRSSNSPWRLFKELCAAHSLNSRERHLVTRLAQKFRLEQPAALFVEVAWWDAERLGPTWVRRMPELDKLRKRLFAVR